MSLFFGFRAMPLSLLLYLLNLCIYSFLYHLLNFDFPVRSSSHDPIKEKIMVLLMLCPSCEKLYTDAGYRIVPDENVKERTDTCDGCRRKRWVKGVYIRREKNYEV